MSIRILDDSGKNLVSRARVGVGLEAPPVRFRRDQGVVGWVCERGQVARIDDAPTDSRFAQMPAQGFVVRSLLSAPIGPGTGQTVGVLCASHAEPSKFTPNHEVVLHLLANLTWPVLERARLERLALPPRLEHALLSPLRRRLMHELLGQGKRGLTLDEAVVCSGRHRADVLACLAPLVQWRILAEPNGRQGYRLRPDLEPALLRGLQALVREQAAEIRREQHVRDHLLGGMIGLDPKMQMVFETIRHVARVDVSVLITGETGTGKELVARAIHDTSSRRDGFYGAVNCATLTESLFESQVFGHAKGAFTGAVHDFVGLAERCDGGTLFLDEVGELSAGNQVKLLRLLQDRSFTRLGETQPRQSDFRLIAATNSDLSSMVAQGMFREDLYYRLAVFPMRIPSLRERLGDLPHLVEGILAVHAQRFRMQDNPPTITADAIRQLERHRWPGNVRELENAITRAAIMAGGSPIGPEHLPEIELLSDRPPDDDDMPSDAMAPGWSTQQSLQEVEREHIRRVLRSQRGNISATAVVLGISRTTLYKKIREYDIDAPM